MPSRKAYTLVNAGRRAWGRTKATLGILVLLLFLGACLIPPPAQGAGRDQSPKELFDRGEFDRAYQEYHRLFLSDPGNPEINFSLGRAAFEAGDFEAAVMAFERVLMARPDAVRVKLEIGGATSTWARWKRQKGISMRSWLWTLSPAGPGQYREIPRCHPFVQKGAFPIDQDLAGHRYR